MSKYIPGNQKHLTLDDRKYFESEWNKGTFYNAHNFCIHRYHCKKTNKTNACGKLIVCGIKCASCPTCNKTCKSCIKRIRSSPRLSNRGSPLTISLPTILSSTCQSVPCIPTWTWGCLRQEMSTLSARSALDQGNAIKRRSQTGKSSQTGYTAISVPWAFLPLLKWTRSIPPGSQRRRS